MSSTTNNNSQIPSHFGTQVAGQNPTSDQQFNNDRLAGGPGATNFPAPSGTHAQQHNLHSLGTPLNQGPTSGGAHNLEREAEQLQAEMERTHPHVQQHGNNQFSQNQHLGQTGTTGPLSSQPAAHNTHGSAVHSGLGTGVSGMPGGAGAEPYATTTLEGENRGRSTILPGTGMSIGGQQHQQGSNLPVPGSVIDHSNDLHNRVDQSKAAQTGVDVDRAGRKRDEFDSRGHHTTATGPHGTTGLNTSSHGPTSGITAQGSTGLNTSSHGPTSGTGGYGNTGLNTSSHGPTSGTGVPGNTGLNSSNHGQSRTGPLEVMGVSGATQAGRGDTTTTHGTTGTQGTGTARTGGTGTGLGHGSESQNRQHLSGGLTSEKVSREDDPFISDQTARHGTGGLSSTEGRKDGNHLGHDTTKATNTGHTASAHKPTSEHAGQTKPSIGDKIAGMADKVQGKITGNPELVAKGEQRAQGYAPKN